MNVSRLNQDKKRRSERVAYESVGDWRFEVRIEISVASEIFKIVLATARRG